MIQATNIRFSNIQRTSINVSWTRGDGTNCILLVSTKPIPSTVTFPNDLNCNSNSFADIDNTAIGYGKVCAIGDLNNVTVTGLTKYTLYYFRVFETDGTEILQDTNTLNPRSRWTLR